MCPFYRWGDKMQTYGLPRITLLGAGLELHSPCPNCLTKQQLIQSLVISDLPAYGWEHEINKSFPPRAGIQVPIIQAPFPLGIIFKEIHSRKASIYSPCSILLLSVFSVSLPIFYGVLSATWIAGFFFFFFFFLITSNLLSIATDLWPRFSEFSAAPLVMECLDNIIIRCLKGF